MTNKFDRIQENTNKKYIIRNCPCYVGEFEKEYSCGCETTELYCQDCIDCIMKQIVESCKNNQKLKWQVGEKPEQLISFNNPLSYQILQLLDIQEIE